MGAVCSKQARRQEGAYFHGAKNHTYSFLGNAPSGPLDSLFFWVMKYKGALGLLYGRLPLSVVHVPGSRGQCVRLFFNCDSNTFPLVDQRDLEPGVACSFMQVLFLRFRGKPKPYFPLVWGLPLVSVGVTAGEVWVIQAHGASKTGC